MTTILIAAALATGLTGGAPPTVPEQTVKAAFLSKFPAYVEWPSDKIVQSMTLCVVGRDRLGASVDSAAAGTIIGGQPIVVRHLARIEATSGCRVAYLGGAPDQSVSTALAALAGSAVLTVTDAEAGPAQGMIHFEIVDHRVRFRIDEGQISAARLVVSSKLLALALTVRTKGPA